MRSSYECRSFKIKNALLPAKQAVTHHAPHDDEEVQLATPMHMGWIDDM